MVIVTLLPWLIPWMSPHPLQLLDGIQQISLCHIELTQALAVGLGCTSVQISTFNLSYGYYLLWKWTSEFVLISALPASWLLKHSKYYVNNASSGQKQFWYLPEFDLLDPGSCGIVGCSDEVEADTVNAQGGVEGAHCWAHCLVGHIAHGKASIWGQLSQILNQSMFIL